MPELEALDRSRGTRLDVVAPRGAAKSTWVSFAYPLWAAVEEREPYVLLLSDSGDQARKYLESIKLELEGNPGLAAAYPSACGAGPVWRQDRIRLRNGVLVEALGTGAKIRGRKNRSQRPTLVVIDDPQNNEHITSPVQRRRTWEWLTREVMEVGTDATNFVALGTALHPECIVIRLLATPGWRSRVFRSVVRWPDRADLWSEWARVLTDRTDPGREAAALAFYRANRAEMERGAEVLWPERESLYALMLKRQAIGVTAFESEKQSNPVNPDSCEWPDLYFPPSIWFEDWPPGLVVRVIALDPSKGRDSKFGDYSACVLVGLDREGTLWVDADLQRRHTTRIVEDGLEHARRFRPLDRFAVEANAFQELLVGEFAQAAAKSGILLPVVGVTNTVNKQVRIRRLGPYLAKGQVRFKGGSPGAALLVEQLKQFPVCDHDDGPDAFEMALRAIDDLLTGGRQ